MPARRGRPPGAKRAKKTSSDVSASSSQPWSDEWSPASAHEAECTLCCNMLMEPARLPCGHRFCLKCVRSAVEMSTGCCPLCRVRCAGWLRRATLQNRLVDDRLWSYIQRTFPRQVANRIDADDSQPEELSSSQIPVVHRKLSAPGEIRNEYESELQKAREERNHLENKYSKENEKIIRDLQEKDRLELLSVNLKIQEDEKFARELAISLNRSTRIQNAPEPVSKDFYNHLGKTANGYKSKTLDSFVTKSKDKPEVKKKPSPPLTAASPELVSTANRCSRFLKNFLNGKLWGFNATSSSEIPSTSKVEPKIWEPEKTCPNSDHELSLNSGVITHRNTTSSHLSIKPSTKIQLDEETTRRKIDSDIESEDSISQELRYFKPIQPNPITRFNGKLVRSLATIKHTNNVQTLNNTILDKSLTTNALEKLRKTEISNLGFNSAFVCLLKVPKSSIKEYKIDEDVEKTPTKKRIKSKNSNDNIDSYCDKNSKTTSKRKRGNSVKRNQQKNSPPKARCKKVSQSCVKDNRDLNLRSRVPANLKRSLSFDNISIVNNTKKNHVFSTNNKITADPDINSQNLNNHRVLRSNGHSEKCNGSLNGNSIKSPSKNGTNVKSKNCTTNVYNTQNGNYTANADYELSLEDFEQTMIEEQKRIEEMIAQEKKDLALAKKLQRQLGGYVINTGYTLRTATKRQASLTELLPPSKIMKT